MFTRTTCIVLTFIVVLQPQLVRPQDKFLPARPGSFLGTGGFANVHALGPIDEVVPASPKELQHESVVNGPMGTSVLEEERRLNPEAARQAENQAEGRAPVVNGPTSTSVALEEGQNLADEAGPFVNGPTNFSVEAEENQQRQEEASEDSPDEGQDQKNRGRISTDPKDADINKQVPSGYYQDTADWSTDSQHWSYKAGEWSLVNLPDPDRPQLPRHEVPGPSLVVITEDVHKKVFVRRKVFGLGNVTLHYRYFLSEGDPPHGIPSLKVYLVQDDKQSLLADEKARGSWMDNTIPVDVSGDFEIIFEGRRNKDGNEIAVDDITISGTGIGDERDAVPEDGTEAEDDAVIDETIQSSNETNSEANEGGEAESPSLETNTENPQNETEIAGGEEGKTEVPPVQNATEVEGQAEVTGDEGVLEGTENSSLVTVSVDSITDAPGNESVTDSGSESEINETAGGAEATDSISNTTEAVSQDPLAVNTTVEVPENVNVTDPQFTELPGINVTNPQFTELPGVNETNPQFTELPGVNATLSPTDTVLVNETDSPVNASVGPSLQPQFTPGTGDNGSVLATTPVTVLTEFPPPGGPSPNITDPYNPDNATVMMNFTTPSGTGITNDPNAVSTAGDDSSSWGMFKIILTICVLGMAGLGFLYWRRRRQQDDEIPVFTRSSHADYHNPTFSPEDDSSFASQGTRHNYKSFD